MVAAAFEWARANNCLRVNPVHKEEEARLILNDDFELIDETGQEVVLSGSVEVEDSGLCIMGAYLYRWSGFPYACTIVDTHVSMGGSR